MKTIFLFTLSFFIMTHSVYAGGGGGADSGQAGSRTSTTSSGITVSGTATAGKGSSPSATVTVNIRTGAVTSVSTSVTPSGTRVTVSGNSYPATGSSGADKNGSGNNKATSVQVSSSGNNNPPASSSLFSTAKNFLGVLPAVAKVVYNSVKQNVAVKKATNYFQENIQPHAKAYVAGVARAASAVAGRPKPAEGTPEYAQWLEDYRKAYYRGVEQSYISQGKTPHNQPLSSGPVNSYLRQIGVEFSNSYYDPRLNENMYSGRGPAAYSNYSDLLGVDASKLGPEEAAAHQEKLKKAVSTQMAMEIDQAYKANKIQLSLPGSNTLSPTMMNQLTPTQRLGASYSTIIIGDSATVNELMRPSTALGGSNAGVGYGALGGGYTDAMAYSYGGTVFVKTDYVNDLGPQAVEDLLSHELQHAGDAAVTNYAYDLLTNGEDLTAEDRAYLEDVVNQGMLASGGKVSEAVDGFNKYSGASKITENEYLDYITEFRAFTNQALNKQAYQQRLVERLNISPANAQKLVDVISRDPAMARMNDTINGFAEWANENN